MAHSHDHSHDDLRAAPSVARVLRIVVAVVAMITIAGLAVWWPDEGVALPEGESAQGDRVNAEIIGLEENDCAGIDFGAASAVCTDVLIEVTSGPNDGVTGSFQSFPGTQAATPDFAVGDQIVVIEFELGDTGQLAYSFADYQRTRPLILLAVLFVGAVLLLGRFQGLRALAGLAVSAIVLLAYAFPALLDGKPPLAVALVAASIIAFAALYLAHGVNDTTTVALLGTMAALGVTGGLAALFTAAANISGVAEEDQIFLLVSAEGIDLRGLVLAGIIIGSLGVLDDVTVTQVSAVARLREANPEYTVRDLYRQGVHIGRDHIASTVNTLVLAYAGASLPLLLYYSNVGIGLSESITSEIVAVEVIRTLVGSIGLISAVPLTTLLAAAVVTGRLVPGFGPKGKHEAPRTTAPPATPEPETPPPAVAESAPATDEDDDGPDWDEFTPKPTEF